MNRPSGGPSPDFSIKRSIVVAVAALVCLSSITVGLVGAFSTSSSSQFTSADDSVISSNRVDDGADAGTKSHSQGDDTALSESVPLEAVEAATEHVSSYESESIPTAAIVSNRSDLISEIERTTNADPVEINEDISGVEINSPRVIERSGEQSVVELYSWSRSQGVLLRWKITVEEGQPVFRRAAAERVGLGTSVNFEGFAPPEGATVINEPTAAHDFGHQKGNLSVSNNFVTVYENGSAESTTISLSDFGPGNETVDINVSIEGTRIQNRTGSPLTLETDENGNGSAVFVPPSSLYSGRTCINATSPSTSIEWCITDRTTGNDNNTMDDERGLLTIEEAREATASGGGETITYVALYTDQNLDNVIEGDANFSKTESDRQKVVDAYLNAVTAANEQQIGDLNFDEYTGNQLDQNKRVPVQINDGTWDFHGIRATKARATWFPIQQRITSNPSIGYGDNITLHARHIMAHEHFHLIQASYRAHGTNNGGKWYMEGQARFMETLADPDVVDNDDSLFFKRNGNGVNGYLRNPDRQSLGNFTYDYAIFWLYLYKQGEIDAIERSIFELNNVSGSGDVDDWAPTALNRVVQNDPHIEQDSYREFMLDFHVAVYRSTHVNGRLDFVTNRDWSARMDPVDTEDFHHIFAHYDEDRTTDAVETWGVDYITFDTNDRPNDNLYFTTNRSDLYTRTIRIGPDSDKPITFPNSIVVRGNLSTGTADPHPSAANNTVYHGSIHDEVVIAVMSLGDGKKSYNLSGRSNASVHRLNNSINEEDETAIYLIPINQPKPAGLVGQYGANGDIFVSVYPSTIPTRSRTGGPRNLTADLTLAAGQSSTASVRQLPTSERIHKTEFVADIDNSESSVWKLTVKEESSTPTDPGNFFVHSNYLDGGPNDGVPADQLFGMPTDINLTPGDMQAGSTVTPNQVSFVVNVDNGDNRYRHSPFPNPDPSHFVITLGGTPIPQYSTSVATLGQGQYRVTFTPPGGVFTTGQHQLCVAFTETKFGVTETTPLTCGPDVTFPVNPPGDGTSIIFDPPILRYFDPTSTIQTSIDIGADNDTISVIHVGEDDSTTAVETTRLDGNRDELVAFIGDTTGSLEPLDGPTAISDGLSASLTQILEADSDAPRAALLVSTGHAKSSGDVEAVVDEFVEAGIPIHVVAVGDNPNRELLHLIADATGGTYHRAVTKDEFETAFRRIDRINGREEVLERHRFTFDGFEERSFRVDATANPLVVEIDLDGDLIGNTTVRLLNPDGEAVTPAGHHDGTYVFRVTSPTAGAWTYALESNQDGTVETIVTSHSTTSLRASTDRADQLGPLSVVRGPSYFPGETVHLGASLVGPEGGLEDAEVTGTLTFPNGEQTTIEYVSQGNGSYGAKLALTEELTESLLGDYTLTVTANRGDVVRKRTLTWTVRSKPFAPEVSIGDVNIAPGGEGQVAVTIDQVPKGFESYNGTVCVSGDTGEDSITDVGSELSLTVIDRTNRCVTFRVTDEAGQVEAGAESITIATLTLSETVPGEAALLFGPPEPLVLDDESERYPTGTSSGTFVVEPIDTETAQVVLDGTPNGLYRVEFSLSADESLGPIVGIQGNTDHADWLADYVLVDGGIGEKFLRIDAIDFENETRDSDQPLLLLEITYATGGESVDLDNALSLTVHRLRNDNGTIDGNGPIGDPIDPDRLVFGVKPPAGASTPPNVSANGDSINEGSLATVSATFTDEDLTDTHNATIDWGDGNTTDVPVDQGAGSGSLSADHRYRDDGDYEVTVTVTDDDGASGSDTANVMVSNVAPTVEADASSIIVDEGETATNTGTYADPGDDDITLSANLGTLTKNADGTWNWTYTPTGTLDGNQSVTITATDDDGASNSTTFELTVRNVAPSVNATGDDIDEGENATVNATFTDPGTNDTHTASVDWGDGTNESVVVDQDTDSLSASHAYGDNGIYVVTVTVTDDDGASGNATANVTVSNLPPSVDLNTSDAVPLVEDDAFIGTANVSQNHTATATDPGSDDLTFAWSNGTTTTYFNDGQDPDPVQSPGGTFPFTAGDTGTVTYEKPGVYNLTVRVTDDDAGQATANATKVITGNYADPEGIGFWRHEYSEKGGANHSAAELRAFLAVTDAGSGVFHENVSAASFDAAHEVLKTDGSSMRTKAEAQALAAWLNFASGRVDWDERIDVDRDGVGDRSFNDTIAEVESILNDEDAKRKDLKRAKDLAEAINGQVEEED